jgi:uncharacterized protein (DUF2147 family)
MRRAILISFLALLAIPLGASQSRAETSADGLWLNPKHSLAVQTSPCGTLAKTSLCGRIVWASKEAQADATDASVPRLLGTELLEDYHPRGKGVWQGTVFVPDMGRRFYSEIDALSPDRLKVKGCILGGLLCKSQVWTRIAQVPA